jgi:hypothetical protein
MVSAFQCNKLVAGCVRILVAMLGITVGLVTCGAAAEVEAQLDRDSVVAGNGAFLTLKVSGGSAGQPEIPAVENLIVEPRGKSQNYQWINGKSTISVTYNYVVGSNVPGDYQIPSIEVTIDGKKLATQPLKLKVLGAAAAQPPPGLQANGKSAPAGGGNTEESGEKRFGFLTVELAASDRKHVYVGEIAPVRIQAWLPDDARVQLRSGIQPEGKAFTLHNVSSQPQQSSAIKDGKRYTVVTWYGGISATKAGKYPASLSFDATVAVRDKAAQQPRRRRTGGPFDDPFFDNIFDDMNTPIIQKEVTLKSDDQEIEVRPLPTTGCPAGFTGAVGDFKIDSAMIPSNWKTGEPQQITARLSGSGNFALMNAPVLTPADGWKTYPNKGEFSSGDEASFSGSKSFQVSAVPRTGGPREVALAFSFFDPNIGAYKTVTSPVQKIQVTGDDIVDEKPAPEPATKEPQQKPADNLVAQHPQMSRRGALVPLVARPAFAEMLEIAVALAGMGVLGAWLRKRWSDPQRRAHAAVEQATREALKAAEHCAAANDAPGYFTAARRALQQRLSQMWNQPAAAITQAEICARLPEDSPVVRFFREADLHAYSPQITGAVDPRWQTLLTEALATLTPNAR